MTEPAYGWGIRITRNNSKPFLIMGIFWTRTEAIADYNKGWVKPDTYKRHRRQGIAKAVKVVMREAQE